MYFWYPQFSQKTNEEIQLYYCGTSSQIIFVRFLGIVEFEIPQGCLFNIFQFFEKLGYTKYSEKTTT